MSDLDEVIDYIGLGKWQLLDATFTTLLLLTSGFQLICGSLLNADVPFICITETNEFYENNLTLSNSDFYSNFSFTSTCPDNKLENCRRVIYDKTTFRSTFVTEYGLICDHHPKKFLFDTFFFAGALISSLLTGFLADKFGRKPLICNGTILLILSYAGYFFLKDFLAIIGLRFLSGFGLAMAMVGCFCLAAEITPTKYRPAGSISPGIGYGLSVTFFGTLGHFFKFSDWRYLLFAANAPIGIIILVLYFLKESPRWQIQNNLLEKAQEGLLDGARINNKTEDFIINYFKTNNFPSTHEKQPSALKTLFAIFNNFFMLRIASVICLIRILLAAAYYGLAFNAANYSKDNPFIYLIIVGMMEVGAIAIAIIFIPFCKRRVLMFVCFIIGGALYFADLVIPQDFVILRWASIMIMSFSLAIAFNSAYIYIPELFPTEVRGQGMSLAMTSNIIGTSCAPMVVGLFSHIWWGIPVALGSSTLICALVIWTLPETKGNPLFNSISDFKFFVQNK